MGHNVGNISEKINFSTKIGIFGPKNKDMKIKIKNLNEDFSEEYLGAHFKHFYRVLRSISEKEVTFFLVFFQKNKKKFQFCAFGTCKIAKNQNFRNIWQRPKLIPDVTTWVGFGLKHPFLACFMGYCILSPPLPLQETLQFPYIPLLK